VAAWKARWTRIVYSVTWAVVVGACAGDGMRDGTGRSANSSAGHANASGAPCASSNDHFVREMLQPFVDPDFVDMAVAHTDVVEAGSIPWSELRRTLAQARTMLRQFPSSWRGWPGTLQGTLPLDRLDRLLVDCSQTNAAPNLWHWASDTPRRLDRNCSTLTSEELRSLMGLMWLHDYLGRTATRADAPATRLLTDAAAPALRATFGYWLPSTLLHKGIDAQAAVVAPDQMTHRANAANIALGSMGRVALDTVRAHRVDTGGELPHAVWYKDLLSQLRAQGAFLQPAYDRPTTATAALGVTAEYLGLHLNLEIGIAANALRPEAGGTENDMLLLIGSKDAVGGQYEDFMVGHSHPYAVTTQGEFLITQGLSAGFGYDFLSDRLHLAGCEHSPIEPATTPGGVRANAGSDLGHLFYSLANSTHILILPGIGSRVVTIPWGRVAQFATPFGQVAYRLPAIPAGN
jgi:hypothetical protein